MKSATGIKNLDVIMTGGFPENSTILIRGAPGTGKSTLCQQFITSGLKTNQPAVYITLDTSPDDIVENMKRFCEIKKFIDNHSMIFLDAYSWKTGGGKDEEWKRVLQGGLDINSLNVTLSNILKKMSEKEKRSVFDSVSTLLLYIPVDLVVRFIPILIAKCKQSKSTQVIIIEEGVHEEEIVNTLSYLSDGVIEMKMDGPKRFMRVTKMRGSSCTRDWLEYSIKDNGLDVKAA
jgi:KaiC/GvpD/RAD55 family RecA-like ATPase